MSGQVLTNSKICANSNNMNVPRQSLVKENLSWLTSYKHLEVPLSMWIGMSPEQQKQSVDKVNKITFGQKIASPSTAMSISTKQLSVKLEDAKVHHVHIERLQNMWQKAEELLSTLGFVVPAAGNIKMCRQVASLSNKGNTLQTLPLILFHVKCAKLGQKSSVIVQYIVAHQTSANMHLLLLKI